MTRSAASIRAGLTGGFGCGKSTVSRFFAQLGCRVLDADRKARELLLPGTDVYRQVVAEFGPDILEPDGRIARRRLAALVFKQPRLRKRLEEIMHPPIMAALEEELAAGSGLQLVEVPLLYEAGKEDMFDLVIAVTADPALVEDRVGAQRDMNRQEVAERAASQIGPREKARRADYVINNSGSLEETRAQVERIYHELVTGTKEKGGDDARRTKK